MVQEVPQTLEIGDGALDLTDSTCFLFRAFASGFFHSLPLPRLMAEDGQWLVDSEFPPGPKSGCQASP